VGPTKWVKADFFSSLVAWIFGRDHMGRKRSKETTTRDDLTGNGVKIFLP
jgi:hypothetical protein